MSIRPMASCPRNPAAGSRGAPRLRFSLRHWVGLLLTGFVVFGAIPAACAAQTEIEQRLQAISGVVRDEIQAGHIPGAVVVVGIGGRIVYRQAFGLRSITPRQAPMTVDTIFDLASLTKVIATTTAIMQLTERGLIDLDKPVAAYWPAFAGGGKGAITIRELLTHYSALPPDLPPAGWSGYDEAIAKIESIPAGQDAGQVRLQRHRFRGPGRDRPARLGPVSRCLCPPLHLRALGHARDDVHAAPGFARPHRPRRYRERHPALGCRAGSHGLSHGRGRGACRAVRHGGRSREIRRDAARGRQRPGPSHPVAGLHRRHDPAAKPPRPEPPFAAMAGTSIRPMPRCSRRPSRRSPSAIPAIPARQFGSIRRAGAS